MTEPNEELREKEIEICVVNGCEGKAIVINDYRVAGSKPWGGGKVETKWTCQIKDILQAIPELALFPQTNKIPVEKCCECEMKDPEGSGVCTNCGLKINFKPARVELNWGKIAQILQEVFTRAAYNENLFEEQAKEIIKYLRGEQNVIS